jgi:hypothetical protein
VNRRRGFGLVAEAVIADVAGRPSARLFFFAFAAGFHARHFVLADDFFTKDDIGAALAAGAALSATILAAVRPAGAPASFGW